MEECDPGSAAEKELHVQDHPEKRGGVWADSTVPPNFQDRANTSESNERESYVEQTLTHLITNTSSEQVLSPETSLQKLGGE